MFVENVVLIHDVPLWEKGQENDFEFLALAGYINLKMMPHCIIFDMAPHFIWKSLIKKCMISTFNSIFSFCLII